MPMDKIIAESPYSIDIYVKQIESISTHLECSFFDCLKDEELDAARYHYFIRHDVDTLACIKNIHLLSRVDHEFNVPSAFYIRVDGLDYSRQMVVDEVKGLKAKGFEVGLHSSCYLEDDFMSQFSLEIKRFEEAFGFRPLTFTLHGLGEKKRENRDQFIKEIKTTYQNYGFKWTDRKRPYPYCLEIQDCHWNSDETHRILYDDFNEIPQKNHQKGKLAVILTHPCYWK